MTQPAALTLHPVIDWCIRRNPLYLLSAALMALGARMLLVTPGAAAGEIELILLTLAVLQLYEMAVSVILLTLHRFQRSPEDQPSLLMVAALFWTGPLAATIELTARDPRAGLGFALASALLAIGEMRFIERKLGLSMGPALYALGIGCLAVVVVSAAVLGFSVKSGPANEIALYATWWAIALVAMLLTPLVRRALRTGSGDRRLFVMFALIALATTATHLYGMNYAFFAHASPAYAAPLLLALAVAAFEFARSRPEWPGLTTVAALIIFGAIGSALSGFDDKFPRFELPALLRNPTIAVLLLAALVWWFGALRVGDALLFHLGTATAVACAASVWPLLAGPGVIGLPTPRGDGSALRWIIWHRFEAASALAAAAAYFGIVAFIRRSPRDGYAALASSVGVVAVLSLGRFASGDFVTLAAALWAVLIGIHLVQRPRAAAIVFVVSALIALGCAGEWRSEVAWVARTHTVVALVVCFGIGYVCGRREWLLIAGGGTAVYCTFLAGLVLSTAPNPLAIGSVIAAFLVLSGGAIVSWQKPIMLRAAQQPRSSHGTRE